ncbi:hypothetical protein HRbin21_01463 [bacterium HR21]|nr:hypothetical protein HRbin21_01463 [bacterium HR21]
MSFEELLPKLEAYFDPSLLADVRTQLPLGAPYEIWGWAVGDFSGDGYPDLALTVLVPRERQRRVRVYAFIDQDGFLLAVAVFPVPYLELPLEVGVAIRDTLCFVTQKHRNGVWSIRGYRYWFGNFVLWQEQTLAGTSSEVVFRYQWLQKHERRWRPDGKLLQRFSIVLPALHRRHQGFEEYARDAVCATVDYVPHGAYYWSGPEDASFRLRAAYDERFLYLALWVTDETVVTGRCDTCPADMLRFWFARPRTDTVSDRSRRKSARIVWERLGISLRLGDFAERAPQLTLHSHRWEEIARSSLWRRAKAVVSRRPHGYSAKLRIPLALLLEHPDSLGSVPLRLPFAAELLDVDNDFRPEEGTTVCTSSDFQAEEVDTYAELLFLPPGQRYGESRNVFAEALLEELLRLGF